GGDDYTVQWTVQNKGSSSTEDASLFDQVYLSDNPTLGVPGARQWFLGSVRHDGVVPVNGSYTSRVTFPLSPEIAGKYVIVVANTGDGFTPRTWEGPYTDDNTNSAATHVTPLAPADLQVTSIVTQAPNYSGEPTSVTWTVTNTGAAAW